MIRYTEEVSCNISLKPIQWMKGYLWIFRVMHILIVHEHRPYKTTQEVRRRAAEHGGQSAVAFCVKLKKHPMVSSSVGLKASWEHHLPIVWWPYFHWGFSPKNVTSIERKTVKISYQASAASSVSWQFQVFYCWLHTITDLFEEAVKIQESGWLWQALGCFGHIITMVNLKRIACFQSRIWVDLSEMEVPLVINHLRLGFSLTKTIRLGVPPFQPPFQETPIWVCLKIGYRGPEVTVLLGRVRQGVWNGCSTSSGSERERDSNYNEVSWNRGIPIHVRLGFPLKKKKNTILKPIAHFRKPPYIRQDLQEQPGNSRTSGADFPASFLSRFLAWFSM